MERLDAGIHTESFLLLNAERSSSKVAALSSAASKPRLARLLLRFAGLVASYPSAFLGGPSRITSPLFLSFDASINPRFCSDKALIFLDRHHYDDGAAVLFDDDWLGASGIEQSLEAIFSRPWPRHTL